MEIPASELLLVEKVNINEVRNFETISSILEQRTALHTVGLTPWEKFPHKPKVNFRIAHCDSLILIKFYVQENHILARHNTPNSPTHKDSCVEFFIDPLNDGNYYNFEFNCIGTTHLAYGPGRHERTFIDPDQIKRKIKTWSTLGEVPFEEKTGNFSWEMAVLIPASIFTHNAHLSFTGLKAKANFFKCGDDTSKPHYLVWNNITTEKPDFHRPEFFGKLNFE